MTDRSQGPGWWQASDLKWYPPEQHPNYVAPPSPPTTPVTPTHSPTTTKGLSGWSQVGFVIAGVALLLVIAALVTGRVLLGNFLPGLLAVALIAIIAVTVAVRSGQSVPRKATFISATVLVVALAVPASLKVVYPVYHHFFNDGSSQASRDESPQASPPFGSPSSQAPGSRATEAPPSNRVTEAPEGPGGPTLVCTGGTNSCVTVNPGTTGPKTTTVCNGNPFCAKPAPDENSSDSYQMGYVAGSTGGGTHRAACDTGDCPPFDRARILDFCTKNFQLSIIPYDKKEFLDGCVDGWQSAGK
jgi:hypothetical protein